MNKQLLERVIKRLDDKLTVDREFMEADEVEQLMNDIDSLQKLLPTEKTELVGCYCPDENKTFVMKYSYIGNELHTGECVGWYCGEPSDEDNKRHANGYLLAVYDCDD